MKETFRLIFILSICFVFTLLLKKMLAGQNQKEWMGYVFFIGAGLKIYLLDWIMRRYFKDFLMPVVLGVIMGGVLSWACGSWISSLSFLAGFLDRLPWKPLLEIFLTFLAVLWISFVSSGPQYGTLAFSKQDLDQKHFKRFHFLFLVLILAAFTVCVFSKFQVQQMWQGRPVLDWMSNMGNSGYDFHLNFQNSMNAASIVLWLGLIFLCVMEWLWRHFCLPWMGLFFLMLIFTGFLNHLFLEMGADALSRWVPSDLLQFFVLFNSIYLAVSWSLHMVCQREFRLPFLKIEVL